MESIEICINNLYSEIILFIDVKNNLVRFLNKEKKIERDLIDELIRTIRNWDKEYHKSNIIDSERFLIKITTNNGVDTIKGSGVYPDNYNTFKELVGKIYE